MQGIDIFIAIGASGAPGIRYIGTKLIPKDDC